MKLQAPRTFFLYFAMSHMQWKIICPNWGEGRQCDMIYQQVMANLPGQLAIMLYIFVCVRAPLGARLFHSAVKCLHYIQQVSASSFLTIVWDSPTPRLNAFNVRTYVWMLWYYSTCVEMQNRHGSAHKECGLLSFGTPYHYSDRHLVRMWTALSTLPIKKLWVIPALWSQLALHLHKIIMFTYWSSLDFFRRCIHWVSYVSAKFKYQLYLTMNSGSLDYECTLPMGISQLSLWKSLCG